MNKILSKESAAVSILVAITVLTFVTLLFSAYVTVSAYRKSQLKSDKRIQEVYAEDVNKKDLIYQNLIEKKDILTNDISPVNDIRIVNEIER